MGGEPEGAVAIGVVIPAYQRPALLRSAIAGAVGQTYPAADIVVVHDEPEVPATAPEIAGIRHMCTGGSAGASGARNLGASSVRGDYLAFCDDDDEWRPSYLARAADALARSGSAVCMTRVEMLVREELRIGPPVPRALDLWTALNEVIGLTGSSIVVRRDAFDAVGGFDTAMRGANDLDFVVRLLHHGASVVAVDEPLVLHRHHDGPRLTTASTRAADLEAFRARWEGHLDRRGRRRLLADVIASRRRSSDGGLERAWLALREMHLIGPKEAMRRRSLRRRR